jgi:iron complex outermembrane receptor protein
LDDIPFEQLVEVPVESVSGVSKYQQSIRRAPAGVTVFTATDIKNYGWTTLADVLRASPGIHIRDDRFYEYVGNRGFTRPRDFNSRTLILLDGHRINDPIYQTGSIGTDFILDLDMVDRIEVISGPGSSVYGSNAFYGAINVIPKTGRDFSGVQAGLGLGSEPSVKARATVGDRTANGVEYVVSATEWWSRGEPDYSLPQSWRSADPAFTARTAHDQDDMHHQSTFARASWRGITGEVAYSRRKKEVLPPVYNTNVETDAYGIDERGYVLLRANGEPGPNSTLSAKLALDYYRYSGLFSPAFAGFAQLAPYGESLSANTEVRWRQTIADQHVFTTGFEYQENFQQDLGLDNRSSGSPLISVSESSRYVSPFAQLDWELAPVFRVSLGGRYDYYSTGDERLTPRVGLIWDATSTTTIKLLYGEAFRVPNVGERYPAEDGLTPNPDLGPETNKSWEIVAEQRLGPVWRVETHVYYINSSDLIIPNATETTYYNAERYITEGFDVGAAAYFSNGVNFRVSATLQNTYDEATNLVVVDAPHDLLKLHFSAPIYEKWLRASAEVLYVGDRKYIGDPSAPANQTGDYVTGNLTLRALRVWHRWDFALSIYNVADTRWSDPKNFDQIVSPPRSVVFRAMLDF